MALASPVLFGSKVYTWSSLVLWGRCQDHCGKSQHPATGALDSSCHRDAQNPHWLLMSTRLLMSSGQGCCCSRPPLEHAGCLGLLRQEIEVSLRTAASCYHVTGITVRANRDRRSQRTRTGTRWDQDTRTAWGQVGGLRLRANLDLFNLQGQYPSRGRGTKAASFHNSLRRHVFEFPCVL